MSKKWSKDQEVDRSNWSAGPWDNEPDFYEWTTSVGYEAYLCRLDSGAWAGKVIAPYPTEGTMLLAFSHTMRDKRRNQIEYQPGMIAPSDDNVEGIGEYCLSMEHWESPGPAYGGRTWNRGPYKTLEETKQICEVVAGDIFETHSTQTYKNYFKRNL